MVLNTAIYKAMCGCDGLDGLVGHLPGAVLRAPDGANKRKHWGLKNLLFGWYVESTL